MKNTISKVLSLSLMCFVGTSFAHAADENSSKAEVNKQIQVCKNKKQGDWVVYANKGVTYNGSCEPNENGKLQFTFPAPAGGATAAAQAQPTTIENTPAVAVESTSAVQSEAPATDATQQASPEAVTPATDATQQANPEAAVDAPDVAQ
ncbi:MULTISPECIES: hypothetical protein [unclassified Acinetobacter]|uniref:hypothetical protein n=1 Tax=unclassified Acinetobacter TaxID=196816 RepID=UPI0025822B6D|nr:hypothetical protein [Acinetobacter sp. 256-1]MDM1760544.1 hypothetical protein [Acinetobacter sp. 251-1]